MVIRDDNTATIIFSKGHGAWGSYFYKPEDDALKVDVTMGEATHTEQLTFEFINVNATSAIATLRWEKKQIPFKVEVDVTEVVLADIRQKLENSPGFNRQTWEQAANYSLNNGGDLNEALGWVNGTIAGQFFSQKNFNNMNIKAGILTKMEKTTEADAVMDEALDLATVFETHGYGRQLIAQGNKERALKVFKMNAKKNKGTWPVDFGLARGYASNGEYAKALKHLKVAEGRAPDQLNKDAIAGFMVKLQNGEDIN
jgi:tetratricopeptide (TPR) repeat protein